MPDATSAAETFRRLLAHLGWADRHLLDALRAAASPSEDALRVYAHVLGAEHVWLSRLRQEEPAVAIWPTLTLDECEALAGRNAAALEALLEGVGEEGLARVVHYRNSAGQPFDTALGDILLHVALHGQYHRGQVNWLLRQGGAEPAPVDYIAFVRGAPAATRRG
ncbi:MAG TPA: DinB family protein [Longimicrobiaceae bacterium]|nr:DinB family protein [Longimicrobiaceae bacterium]